MALPLKKRVLISVSDKTGVVDFAKELDALGYDILSTGGTALVLRKAGLHVLNVSDITGFPECLDGRVKTLHPMVHAGILAVRSNPEHMKQLRELNVLPIDVVAINLYPFKQTILQEKVTREEAIENIDVGGPAMLRAAAKNWQDVSVIVNPDDYKTVISELKALNTVTKTTKLKLAYKVFEHTSAYDTLIAKYLQTETESDLFPDTLTLTYDKVQDMRYGENPHQRAAFYKEIGKNFDNTFQNAEQLHGIELSYNQISDANYALDIVKEFYEPCKVIIKNGNLLSINGSCEHSAAVNSPVTIALNRTVDEVTANEINRLRSFTIIAPDYTAEALNILQRKYTCIFKLPKISLSYNPDTLEIKSVAGGLLVQKKNTELLYESELNFITETKPTDDQMRDLILAVKAVKHVKSNSAIIAKDNAVIGVGAGQTSRINALELAVKYAGNKIGNSVMSLSERIVGDDCECIELAAKSGIKAIIQPTFVEKSVELCNKYGMAMVLIGMSHYKN